MFKSINNPVDYEIRTATQYLYMRNITPANIFWEISEVCGEKAMRDGMLKSERQFDEEHSNVHDEQRSGCPSVVNKNLVMWVDERE